MENMSQWQGFTGTSYALGSISSTIGASQGGDCFQQEMSTDPRLPKLWWKLIYLHSLNMIICCILSTTEVRTRIKRKKKETLHDTNPNTAGIVNTPLAG